MEFTKENIQKGFDALTEETKPKWGLMTAQHMVEHLEWQLNMALGKFETEIATPEERLEKYQDSLYNYRAMPNEFKHPMLRKEKAEDLRHATLADAKKAFWETYEEYQAFFKENPDAETPNTVFGMLNKEMWDLLGRKHTTHHFKQFGLV